jgi:hypothetical protein
MFLAESRVSARYGHRQRGYFCIVLIYRRARPFDLPARLVHRAARKRAGSQTNASCFGNERPRGLPNALVLCPILSFRIAIAARCSRVSSHLFISRFCGIGWRKAEHSKLIPFRTHSLATMSGALTSSLSSFGGRVRSRTPTFYRVVADFKSVCRPRSEPFQFFNPQALT